MGRPEKPVNAAGGVASQFAQELRALRARAGNPTYREMARSAMFSSSVLSSAASGNRLPSLQVTLAFVAACGGDERAWRQYWYTATGSYAEPSSRGRKERQPWRRWRGGDLPHPAQLPQRPRGFVGRAAELAWLRTPGDTPVVISGPAGVGKSELALHYAHGVAVERPDGQLYADLGGPRHGGAAPTAPSLPDVLDGLLRALGVSDEQLGGSFDHRIGLYRTLLAERRLLVLLDNVRDECQVRPLLAETTTSTILLVSRNRLLGLRDVRRLQLAPLSRGDSIAMIATALSHLGIAAGAERDRLAEFCGDLPIALDIALRKIASRPHLTLRRVVEGWCDHGQALDWLSVGDLSVLEMLRSAYGMLNPAAREMLWRLARSSAEEPLPVATDRDEQLVEEIADAGLLAHWHHGTGACRLSPLVRAFVLRVAEAMPNELTVAGSAPAA
ncbi:helix-turn-helix domain-containing protein [Amycolatopsis australiensis]|uniref:Helix-turn-helix domain-containing protein n=1 Tax=Amycolatopsis australiensis TaxID=546364 RepID=A0A1K1T3A1_9PSEU|nr:helix-turn-helix domain-containing protein [Amycolatopsis australiensis]SFW91051.1 Helix-turn-helix domain-containing protein [Amycolatopsis australiensis]